MTTDSSIWTWIAIYLILIGDGILWMIVILQGLVWDDLDRVAAGAAACILYSWSSRRARQLDPLRNDH